MDIRDDSKLWTLEILKRKTLEMNTWMIETNLVEAWLDDGALVAVAVAVGGKMPHLVPQKGM